MPKDPLRVLVVDDEPKITEVVGSYLRRAGYEVVVATTATSAFEIASAKRDAIDVLVADTALRGTSALAFAAEIRRAKGNLPVVFVGGDTGDEAVPSACDLLRKPFTPAALLRKVRGALGAS